MRVRVHPHRGKYLAGNPDCVSVTPDPGSGVYYVPGIEMHNVHFRVHQSGFRRMQESGVRNVHAWAVGEQAGIITGLEETKRDASKWQRVEYDFRNGRFVMGDRVLDKTDVFDVALCIGRNFYVRSNDGQAD
jgi:hypothetical protein